MANLRNGTLTALIGTSLLAGGFNANADQATVRINNSTAGLNQPLAKFVRTQNATPDYDPFFDADLNDQGFTKFIKFYAPTSIPGHEELSMEARQSDDPTTQTNRVESRGISGAISAYLSFNVNTNSPISSENVFSNKNVFADVYSVVGDQPSALIGTYDIKQMFANSNTVPLVLTNGYSHNINIRVERIFYPPIANDSSFAGTKRETISGHFNVSDSDGTVTNVAVINGDAKLNVSGTNFSYNANGFTGTNVYSFFATDNQGAKSTTNTLSLVTTNTPPVASNQTNTVLGETLSPIELSGLDADNDGVDFLILSGPANGDLTGSGSNRVYRASNNYYGPDNFTYVGTDGTATSAVATVSLSVQASNRAPYFTALTVTGTQVDLTAFAQPNRELRLLATEAADSTWLVLQSQSVPLSADMLVALTNSVPLTNAMRLFRLESVAP